ncbi:O-antigen ligase family protein [Candidatus Riflebacteria bacterium]
MTASESLPGKISLDLNGGADRTTIALHFYVFFLSPVGFYYFPGFTLIAGFLLVAFLCLKNTGRSLSQLDFFFWLWFGVLLLASYFSVNPVNSIFFCAKILFLYLLSLTCHKYECRHETILLFFLLSLVFIAGDSLFLWLEGIENPLAWNDARYSGGIFRIQGTFNNPNILAAYIICGYGFCLLKPERVLSKILAVLQTVLLCLTYSRGALLAVLPCLVLFACCIPEKRKFALLLLVGLLSITIFSGLLGRVYAGTQKGERGINQRLGYFYCAFRAFCRSPVTGFGPTTFAEIYPEFRRQSGSYTLYAHNEILQQLCEVGFLGPLVFLAGLFFLLKLYKEGNFHDSFFQAVLLGQSALLLHSFVSFSFRIYPITVIAFYFFGCQCANLPAILPGKILRRVLLFPITLFILCQLAENYSLEKFAIAARKGQLTATLARKYQSLIPWNLSLIVNNPFESMKKLHELRTRYPHQIPITRAIVKRLLKNESYKKAVPLIEDALKWDPHNEELRYFLAICQLQLKEHDAALKNMLFFHRHIGRDYLHIQPYNLLLYKLMLNFLPLVIEKENEVKARGFLLQKFEECKKNLILIQTQQKFRKNK